jgi:hypothetical protein
MAGLVVQGGRRRSTRSYVSSLPPQDDDQHQERPGQRDCDLGGGQDDTYPGTCEV